MSTPLSDNRTYFDAVQNYFLERTGKGLVLSSRDLELLLSWRRSGASAAIICQGIDEAVDTLKSAPRDLHACKKYVEPRLDDVNVRMRPSASFSAPKPAAPVREINPENRYVQRLVEAQQSASVSAFGNVYRSLCARFTAALSTGADPVSTAYDFDDLLVDEAYQALQTDQRLRIDTEIDSRFGAHLAMMPPEGREETIRASRRDILQKSFGLVGLVD